MLPKHRQPLGVLRIAAVGLLITSMSLPAPGPVHAGLLANELIQEGRASLQRGDYEQAIDAFSKALAVDPRNKEAKAYLKQMGLEDGLYTPARMPLHHIADMAEKNISAQKKIEEVSAAYEKSRKLNRLLERDRRYLHQAVQEKEIRLSKVENLLTEKEKQLKLTHEQQRRREQELALVQNNLMVLKETLAAKITALKDKDEQLQQLRQMVKDAEVNLLQKEKDHTQRLRVLKERFAAYRAEAERTQQAFEEYIRKLEEKLRQRGLQLGSFKNKLIATEFKLTQRERQLVQKSHEVIALRRMITELESQLQALQAQWGSASQQAPESVVSESQQPRPRDERRVDEAARLRFHKNRVRLLQQLNHQLQTIRQDVEDLLQRRQALRHGRRGASREMFVSSIDGISRRLAAMQEKLASLEKDAGRLYQETGEPQDLLAAQDLNHRKLMVATLEEQVAELKKKIEQEWNDLKKTDGRNDSTFAQTHPTSLKDADFRDILNDIRQELNQAQKSFMQDDVALVKSETKTTGTETRSLTESRDADTAPQNAQATRHEAPRSAEEAAVLTALKKELAAAKKELTAMEGDVIDETVDELSREYLVKEQSDVIKSLEKELAAAKEELASAKHKESSPEESPELKRAQEKINQLQAQLQEAREKLSFLKEAPAWTLSTKRLEKLRDRLVGIRSKMQELFARRRNDLKEMQERYEHLKEHLHEVEAALLERNEQIQALEQQLEMILAIGGSR